MGLFLQPHSPQGAQLYRRRRKLPLVPACLGHECNQLSRITLLRNDLLCVDWNVEPFFTQLSYRTVKKSKGRGDIFQLRGENHRPTESVCIEICADFVLFLFCNHMPEVLSSDFQGLRLYSDGIFGFAANFARALQVQCSAACDICNSQVRMRKFSVQDDGDLCMASRIINFYSYTAISLYRNKS